VLLAVAISAFYWLPVLTESDYVGLGHGASAGYQDHLLSWFHLFSWKLTYPYPSSSEAARIFPVGLVQGLLLVVALLLVVRPGRRAGRDLRAFFLLFLAVALGSVFMLTTASLPVWRALEGGLAFLQYPWRFQAVTVLATAVLAGAVVQVLTKPEAWGRIALVVGLLLATGIWTLGSLTVTPTTYAPSVEAMWQMDRDHGQAGTTWTGEYVPIWVEEQRWAFSHSAAKQMPMENPLPENGFLQPGQVRLTGVGHTRYDLTVVAPQGTDLALHQFYYPGWRADQRDGPASFPAQPQGVLGLAAYNLPPGTVSLALRLGHTPTQRWGTLISLAVSLAVGVALVALHQLSASRSTLILAGCFLVLTAVLLASLFLSNGYVRATNPVNANLENAVELLAYATDRPEARVGTTLDVTIYWRSLRTLAQDYKTFVHLTDPGLTRQPSQHDGDPGGEFTPTSRWLPGELVPDMHRLSLPADMAPGRYLLWAGMYEFDTLRNLSVLEAEVPVADGRILLGEIQVLP
jgi:hypothetical protein